MSIPYAKLNTNTMIQGVERIASVLLGIAIISALTRLLGVAQFGIYSTITVLLQFAASIVDLGLGLTLSQLLAEPKADPARILGSMIPFRLLTSAVSLLGALAVSLMFGYPAIVPLGILASFGGFICLQLSQLLSGYFRTTLAMGIVAVAEIFQRTLYLFLLLWLPTGSSTLLLPVLWAGTITQLIGLLIVVVRLGKRVPLRWNWDRAMLTSILRRNLPLSLSMLATLIYFKADTVILSLFRTPAEVGLYSAPYRLLETLVNMPHLFLSLVLPIATTAWHTRDFEKLRSLARWSFTTTLVIALPMLVGGIMVAEPLMTLVAGRDFAASGSILQILLIATFAIMIGTQSAYIVLATNHQRRMLPLYVIAAVCALASYLLFIPRYGYWAAAWTTVGVEVMMATANIILAAHVLRWRPDQRQLTQVTAATIVMAIGLVLLHGQTPLMIVPAAALLYGLTLLFSRFKLTPPEKS